MRFTAGGLTFPLFAYSTLCVALPNPISGLALDDISVELTVSKIRKPGPAAFHLRLINNGDTALYYLAAIPQWVDPPTYHDPLTRQTLPSDSQLYRSWFGGFDKWVAHKPKTSLNLSGFFLARDPTNYRIQAVYNLYIANQVPQDTLGPGGTGFGNLWTSATIKSNVVELDVSGTLEAEIEVSMHTDDTRGTAYLPIAIKLTNKGDGPITILQREPIVNGVPTLLQLTASSGPPPQFKADAIPSNEDCRKSLRKGAEEFTIPQYGIRRVYYNLANVVALKIETVYKLSIPLGGHIYACYVSPLGEIGVVMIPVAARRSAQAFGPLRKGRSVTFHQMTGVNDKL